jgi:hypothetical protein
MNQRQPQDEPASKDRLVSRPNEPLPTVEDPAGPHARGYPADPKPKPAGGQGTDPHAGDLDHSA